MRFCFMCLVGLVSSSNLSHAKLNLVHLNGPIYICEDHFYARENTVVFVGEDSVTVAGATWTPETAKLLDEAIKKITPKPVRSVINTNYHPDRAGGNGYWKSIGCDIHSTQLTFDLLKADWESICEWTRKGIPDFPDINLTLPTIVHSGDFALQKNKIQVIYFGPAHTVDGVIVYFPEQKVLYGGCMLKPFLGNLDQADLNAYPQTLISLKKRSLEISTIVAGHGTSVHSPDLVDQYLLLLEDHIRKNRIE